MKLNKLFYALLALPLVFAACKKSDDAPKPDANYLFDVEMATAERVKEIPEEGIIFQDNQFMIVFQDANQDLMFSLLIQGEDGETVLSAGTYTSARGAVELQGSFVVTADGTTYQLAGGEGSVTVTYSEAAGYGIEANFTDAKANKYHFTYNGEIANMSSDVVALDGAQRHDPKDLGENLPDHYYVIMFHDASFLLRCGLVLIGAEGENILTAGTYTIENGGIHVPGCELITYGDKEYSFSDGSVEVVVGGDVMGYTFDIQLADADGNSFHYSYEGKVDNMDPAGDLMPYFRGSFTSQPTENGTYNYAFMLSDKGLSDQDSTLPYAMYYMINLYSTQEGVADADNYVTVPVGEYTYENARGKFTAGTFDGESSLAVTGEDGKTGHVFSIQSGKVIVAEDCITLDLMIDDVRHHVRYDGAPLVVVK